MWTIKHIRVSNYLKSIISFLLPLTLGLVLEPIYIALWFFVRGTSQIIYAYIPNPFSALIYIKRFNIVDIQSVFNLSVLIFLSASFFVSVLLYALLIFVFPEQNTQYNFYLLCLYSVVFNFSNHICSYFIGVRQSKYLLNSSVLDVVLNLALFTSLIVTTDWFVFLAFSLFKEFVKVFVLLLMKNAMITKCKNPKSVKIKWSFYKVALWKGYLRQPLKTLYQSFDRTLFPLLFGSIYASTMSMGSSIAMIIAILSSSAVTWLSPLIDKSKSSFNFAIMSWVRFLMFICAICMTLYFLGSYDTFGLSSFIHDNYDLELYNIMLGFAFSSTSSICSLSLVVNSKRLTELKWVFRLYIQIALGCFFIFLMSEFTAFSNSDVVLLGVCYNIFSFVVVNFKELAYFTSGCLNKYVK